MPYSGVNDKSLPSKVKKMSSGKRKKWVSAFNSAHSSCKAGKAKPKDGQNCEGYAFAVAYAAVDGSTKRSAVVEGNSILKVVFQIVDEIKKSLSSLQQRAISISSIGNATFEEFLQQGAFLTDIYFDNDGSIFAVASQGGKLFRASLSIGQNGEVEIGELQEVMPEFEPVNRAAKLESTDDGRTRMLSISATSVLNREGQIDSRQLFDSMADYMERTGKTIPRTFFHAGNQFKTGEIIHMIRDDNVLITVTEFDEDSEIAKREIQSREEEPDYWGDSIEYIPVGDPELLDVGDGITIPVYRSGIPHAVSTLPAFVACSHYANKFQLNKQEVKRMTLQEVQKQALIRLFGGDEAAVDEWLENNVSAVNRQIADADLITRAEDDVLEEPAGEETLEEDVVEEEPAEEPAEELESESEDEPEEELVEEISENETEGDDVLADEVIVEFDDEMAQQVANIVIESDFLTEFKDVVTNTIARIEQTVEELTITVGELQAASVARSKDIDMLKRSDEEKHEEWEADLPRKRRNVSFRPRNDATEDAPKDQSMQDIADETLAQLEGTVR